MKFLMIIAYLAVPLCLPAMSGMVLVNEVAAIREKVKYDVPLDEIYKKYPDQIKYILAFLDKVPSEIVTYASTFLDDQLFTLHAERYNTVGEKTKMHNISSIVRDDCDPDVLHVSQKIGGLQVPGFGNLPVRYCLDTWVWKFNQNTLNYLSDQSVTFASPHIINVRAHRMACVSEKDKKTINFQDLSGSDTSRSEGWDSVTALCFNDDATQLGVIQRNRDFFVYDLLSQTKSCISLGKETINGLKYLDKKWILYGVGIFKVYDPYNFSCLYGLKNMCIPAKQIKSVDAAFDGTLYAHLSTGNQIMQIDAQKKQYHVHAANQVFSKIGVIAPGYIVGWVAQLDSKISRLVLYDMINACALCAIQHIPTVNLTLSVKDELIMASGNNMMLISKPDRAWSVYQSLSFLQKALLVLALRLEKDAD